MDATPLNIFFFGISLAAAILFPYDAGCGHDNQFLKGMPSDELSYLCPD